MSHRSGGERVEADDAILLLVVNDEGPRRANSGGLWRMLLKPKIQRLDPAVEVVRVVSWSESAQEMAIWAWKKGAR